MRQAVTVRLESGEKLAVTLTRRGLRIYRVCLGCLWARTVYATQNLSDVARCLYGRLVLPQDDLLADLIEAVQSRRSLREVRWLLRAPTGRT